MFLNSFTLSRVRSKRVLSSKVVEIVRHSFSTRWHNLVPDPPHRIIGLSS